MPLPGGPADKLGNRYENWWTVLQLVQILWGKFEGIRIEDPTVDKAEFVLEAGDRREWHQTKRSHDTGKWSLADLAREGVLQAVQELLAGNGDRFVFVSSSDARELAELSERARSAATPDEFRDSFLLAEEQAKRFHKLCNHWGGCDLTTAYNLLRRIEVQTADERTIDELVHSGVAALFLSKPAAVIAELRTIIQDSVHQTITRDMLVARLAERGFVLRRVNLESAAAIVSDTTQKYLQTVRFKLIQHKLLAREETNTLFKAVLESGGGHVALTGGAGYGKTACVLEFIEHLQQRGVFVLAFRLDRIAPVSTARDLGKALGLEESPVLVLEAAAGGREAVLLVDQLDAISAVSGRSTEFLDAVEELLIEARGIRNSSKLHVVVVCREFDWENDHRLKRLLGSQYTHVQIGKFSVDQLKNVLSDAGFDWSGFNARQLQLLTLPQNLALFVENGDPAKPPSFNTATELFSHYWNAKRKAVLRTSGNSPDQWMNTIVILTDEMTRTQQLSVPKERLDSVSPGYLNAMASEGVLTFDGKRYGFGHESFFDYCFARTFLNKAESLVTYLTGAEQHLFRRTQVRQVLIYLRDADGSRYIQELQQILTDSQIRYHLKDLALTVLASVPDPTSGEWGILWPLLQPTLNSIQNGTPNLDKLSQLSWRHFFSSAPWFDFVDRRNLIAEWLASNNENLVNTGISCLRVQQRHSPDRVADLLTAYADLGGAWPSRLRYIISWAEQGASRKFLDLTLRLIDNGTLDHAKGPIAVNATFWDMFYELANSRPEWTSEVIAHWLQRKLDLWLVAEQPRPRDIIGNDSFAGEPFQRSAKNAPAAFVEHVLPVVLRISDSAADTDDKEPPRLDAVWVIPIKGGHSLANVCLAALDDALAVLANGGADNLRATIEQLRGRQTYTANHLLLSLYTAGATQYADEAVDLLCAETWRFKCGFTDSAYWTATELIRAAVPLCSSDRRSWLESIILAYVSPYERTASGLKHRGYTSFSLLSAFPDYLLSAEAKRRRAELSRKFQRSDQTPRGIVAGWVGPPIEEKAASKMTDEQWLGAIAKYGKKGMRLSGDEFKGGALELARSLQTFVQNEPERFAQLSLRFPTGTNPVYFEHVLMGLKNAKIPNDLKLEVCRKTYGHDRDSCGRIIADVLGTFEEPLPDDAVQMLAWLATKHPDPKEELWKKSVGKEKYYGGEVYTNGINTTRGVAAEAIRDLIWRNPEYIERFRETLHQMIRDPSPCVRSCVAGTLRAIANHDTRLAFSLFENMDLTEESLLLTPHLDIFIRANLREHFDALRPVIERMVRSGDAKTVQAGARLASIAFLHHQGAADLETEAFNGNQHQRLGVAQVAVANVTNVDLRTWCKSRLTSFFDDQDADVRKTAASCLRNLSDALLSDYEDLILALSESPAYADDSFSILHSLEDSAQRLPGITSVVCEKFLDRFAPEASDIRTSRMGDGYLVAKLVFRTYQQHQNDEWTGRTLDLIDRLCVESIGETQKQLDTFER
jgi:hypothetical protein